MSSFYTSDPPNNCFADQQVFRYHTGNTFEGIVPKVDRHMMNVDEHDLSRRHRTRPPISAKGWPIISTALAVISVSILSPPSDAAQQKSTRKTHSVHARKAPSKHKNSFRAALVPLEPVLDTTCIDTLDDIQRSLTNEINRWSNVRYKHGGASPKGIDCSGFTFKVFEKAVNYKLPRTSREQAKIGEEIDKDSLTFGDLLFFYSKSKKHKRINHVAIYVGDGSFVHSHRHHGVGIDSLDESYYARHFAVAKRVLPLAAEPSEDDE